MSLIARIRDFRRFVGPGLVRDFQIFIGPGLVRRFIFCWSGPRFQILCCSWSDPVRSWISIFFWFRFGPGPTGFGPWTPALLFEIGHFPIQNGRNLSEMILGVRNMFCYENVLFDLKIIQSYQFRFLKRQTVCIGIPVCGKWNIILLIQMHWLLPDVEFWDYNSRIGNLESWFSFNYTLFGSATGTLVYTN